MLQVTLHRSTALSDARLASAMRLLRPARAQAQTRVGGLRIGVGPRTLIGGASAFSRVGQTYAASSTLQTPARAVVTEAPAKDSSIVSGLKTVGWVLLAASFLAGPPAVGYLLFGKWGLLIGSVIAAPIAVYTVYAAVSNQGEATA